MKSPPEPTFRRFGETFFTAAEYQGSADFLHFVIEKHYRMETLDLKGAASFGWLQSCQGGACGAQGQCSIKPTRCPYTFLRRNCLESTTPQLRHLKTRLNTG